MSYYYFKALILLQPGKTNWANWSAWRLISRTFWRRKWWSDDHELDRTIMEFHDSSWSYKHGKTWHILFNGCRWILMELCTLCSAMFMNDWSMVGPWSTMFMTGGNEPASMIDRKLNPSAPLSLRNRQPHSPTARHTCENSARYTKTRKN